MFQLFHQSQATCPGVIHEMSDILGGEASFCTMSFFSSSLSLRLSATARHGKLRVPVVLAMKFPLFVGIKLMPPNPPSCACRGYGAYTPVNPFRV